MAWTKEWWNSPAGVLGVPHMTNRQWPNVHRREVNLGNPELHKKRRAKARLTYSNNRVEKCLYGKEWYEKNKSRFREYRKVYVEKNRDLILEKAKEYSSKETYGEYWEAHRAYLKLKKALKEAKESN